MVSNDAIRRVEHCGEEIAPKGDLVLGTVRLPVEGIAVELSGKLLFQWRDPGIPGCARR